jgi:UDP-N-acetylmuramoyl-L-alanyl-D-glutamate--2,6-diaminopimelate ligase
MAAAIGVPPPAVDEEIHDVSIAFERIVVDDTLVAARKLAAFFRKRFPFPVIAVGGSNGKTTTKDLIAAALGPRAAKTPETMNGWTGIPFTLLDRSLSRDTTALVVEVGIDAVGAMKEHAALVDPDVSVLTMIGPEHLAGLGDLDTVAREELLLFTPRARRVVNMSDARLAPAARDGDVRVEGWMRLELGPYWTGIEWSGEFEVPLAGAHNASNLALAVAVARSLGRSDDEIRAGLAAFEPPSMRCQIHRLATDTILIDDAYNASPPSMAAACALLDAWPSRKRILVLGDMLDLGAASEAAHAALVPVLEKMKDARIYLDGEAMAAVHRALPGSVHGVETIDDIRGAVVLVKGSRGMHLERVVAALRERGEQTTAEDLAPLHPLFATACVTGTNGKTTTTSMISAITKAAGETPCRVTTIGAFIDDVQLETEPSGAAFVRTMLEARDRGVKTLAVETSSQALENGFTKTWPARVGVFTNLSRDHLDYHGTPEKYLVAKAQLFIDLPLDGTAVLNAADPASALLDEVIDSRVRRLGYAARPVDAECTKLPLALSATEVSIDVDGTHAVLAPSPIADALGGRLDLRLVGHVHMENALAAALAGHALGFSFDVIKRALTAFEGVPGRFQIVHRRPTVVIDYAHTPDALARTLATARALNGGRVLLVFGCGGDRDPGKRPQMGVVAVDGADVVYVTNDNPRSESPRAIADAILAGVKPEALCRTHCILDREEAIKTAVRSADPADIVVVAGKGHEKTQTIGDRELPFDDVEIARAVFR